MSRVLSVFSLPRTQAGSSRLSQFYKSCHLVPIDMLILDSSGNPIFSSEKVIEVLIAHPATLTTKSSGSVPSQQGEVAASFPNQATLVRTRRGKGKGSNILEAICSAGWFSLFIFYWQSFLKLYLMNLGHISKGRKYPLLPLCLTISSYWPHFISVVLFCRVSQHQSNGQIILCSWGLFCALEDVS